MIADAHMDDRRVPIVERMLSQTPAEVPAFEIDRPVTDFYAFTRERFSLNTYHSAPFED